MKGKKRVIALLLSFLMVLSQMSVATFALDTVAPDGSDQAVAEQPAVEEPAVEETQPEAAVEEEPVKEETSEVKTAAVETESVSKESADAPAPTEPEKKPEATEPAATEPEKTEPAAEPVAAEPEKEEVKEAAFDQSKNVDGVKITVKADKGVFPAGSELSVSKASVPAAVDTEDAAKAYAFDISILADGKKIQPDGNATVSFTTEEVAEYDTAVYHMDGGAQEMSVSESGSTASVKTDGFSVYVVKFVYEGTETSYRLNDGEPVELGTILGTDANIYDDGGHNKDVVEITGGANARVVTAVGEGTTTISGKYGANPQMSTPFTISVTVSSGEIDIDPLPEAVGELAFTGEAQSLLSNYKAVADGLPDGYQMYYRTKQDGNWMGKASTDEPKGTDAATYDIRYQLYYNGVPVEGDEYKGSVKTAIKYKVEFAPGEAGEEAQGMPAPVLVEAGGKVDKPTDPTWSLHALDKWMNEDAEFNFVNDQVTSNLTLTATWKSTERSVIFDADNGTSKVTVKVEKGSTVDEPEDPERGNDEFLGWYVADNNWVVSDQKFDFGTKINSTTRLKAKWHVHNVEFTKKNRSTYEFKCTNPNCSTEGKTYTASITASGGPYTGKAYEATTSVEDNPFGVTCSDVEYYEGDTKLDEAPVACGTYTARTSVKMDEVTKFIGADIVITKADATVTDPSPKDASELVIVAGETLELLKEASTTTNTDKEAVVEYILKDKASEDLIVDWTSNLDDIAVRAAGTYIVRARVLGTTNFKDAKSNVVTITVKGPAIVRFDPNGGTVDTPMEDQVVPLETEVKLRDCTYSKEGSKFLGWSKTPNPTYEDVDYPVDDQGVCKGTFEGNTTIYAVWQEYASVKLEPKGKALEYNGEDQNLIELGLGNNGTMVYFSKTDEYKPGDEEDINNYSEDMPYGDAAGEYDVWYMVKGDEGYADFGPVKIEDVEIAPKTVTVSGLTAEDKDYDGTTDATIDCSEAEFDGRFGEDELTITNVEGTFESADGGTWTVTLDYSKAELGGKAKDNYVLAETGNQETTTATIRRDKIEVTVTGMTAENKVYDGTKDATLVKKDGHISATINGLEEGDDVYVTADANFKYKGAGTEKIVQISNIKLAGNDADKYELAAKGNQKGTYADIFPKVVTVNGIEVEDKEYDGTKDATIITDDDGHIIATIDGLIDGDDVYVTANANFKYKGAGTDKIVQISDIALEGKDVANYELAAKGNQKGTYADITPKKVTFTWMILKEGMDPVEYTGPIPYDGYVHNISAVPQGVLPEDEGDVEAHLDGVKEARNCSVAGYTVSVDKLTGAESNNYTFDDASLDWNIEKADLTIQANDVVLTYGDDPYDNGVTYTGLVASDKSRVNPDRPARGVINGALQFKYHVRGDKETEYVAGSDASEFVDKGYVVDPKSSELSATNYNITLKVGTLTVNKKHVVFSWDKVNPSKIYDGEPLAVEATTNDIIDQDEDYVIVAYDPEESNTATNVVNAKETSAFIDDMTDVEKAKNYYVDEDSNAENTITITPAALMITAADQVINYGQDFNKTAVSYSGFVGGENESVLTAKPTVTSTYVVNGKAGTYPLTPGGAAAKNYTITYVNGKLTVNDVVSTLVAWAKAKGSKKAAISWNSVTGAVSYDVYFNKCNTKGKKYNPKLVATVSGTSYTKKGLKKGTCYKFYVVAKDASGKVLAVSNLNHFVAGNASKKHTNAKSITASPSPISVTKGGNAQITVSQKKAKKGKKLLNNNHAAKVRYTSSNPAVATVSANGVVTGVSSGYCVIYVQAVNGLWTTVEVNVQ